MPVRARRRRPARPPAPTPRTPGPHRSRNSRSTRPGRRSRGWRRAAARRCSLPRPVRGSAAGPAPSYSPPPRWRRDHRGHSGRTPVRGGPTATGRPGRSSVRRSRPPPRRTSCRRAERRSPPPARSAPASPRSGRTGGAVPRWRSAARTPLRDSWSRRRGRAGAHGSRAAVRGRRCADAPRRPMSAGLGWDPAAPRRCSGSAW